MSDDLNSRLEALDALSVDLSDPDTYTRLLYGAEGQGASTTTSAPALQGDTAAAPAPAPAEAPATAPAPAPVAPPAAAPAAAAPATSSASPAAAEPNQEQRIDGVATKDGKHYLPFAVLQATRDQLKTTSDELAKARAKLEEQAAAASNSDLAARAAENPHAITDAELAELESDFPLQAKVVRQARDLNERLRRLEQNPAPAPAPTQAPAPAQQPAASPQDEFDMALASSPQIKQWMEQGGAHWERAQAIDEVLAKDPNWIGKPMYDRFQAVQRMVSAEFGLAAPAAPAPSPAPTSAPAAPAAAPAAATPAASAAPAVPAPAPIQTMPTLTDFGGAPVQSGDAMAGMTTGQMVDKAMSMSEEQLRQMVGLNF